ncbi:MAG: hypothetical protein AB1758_18010, partial [Candidatus Eremiobacterota bacterium]
MRTLLLSLFLVLAALPGWAQTPPVELTGQVSQRSLKMGQSLKLTVEVSADPGVDLKLPEAASLTFEPWEVRDAVLVRLPSQRGRDRWRYTFRLAGYEPGNLEVPPLKLSYTFAGLPREAASEAVGVTVAEPEKQPEG